jgi:hypothetical protein
MLRRRADLLLPGLLLVALATLEDPRLLAGGPVGRFRFLAAAEAAAPFAGGGVDRLDDESLERLGQWPWSRARSADRLRSGKIESLETSGLHLDVLRDLKRINSHLTSVAYPILEGAGALTESRLKQEA